MLTLMEMKKFEQKKKIALLMGGRSGEHEVSLVSATSIYKNLDASRFDIFPIGIAKNGAWYLIEAPQDHSFSLFKICENEKNRLVPLLEPRKDGLHLIFASEKNRELVVDIIFPMIHGTFGEDGCLQGLLEFSEIPYVGADVVAAGIAIDKGLAKRVVYESGIAIPKFQIFKKPDASILEKVFKFPLFVKPSRTGSSVGIRKVVRLEELESAMRYAFRFDDQVLVEQAIDGREIELSVLENSKYGEPPRVSLPGEIVLKREFYSYEAKYLEEDAAELQIPARLTSEQVKKAQETARKIFEVMACQGYARVDLFLGRQDGVFYFNEINTIPGFTKISMFPKLWEASGIPYRQLLTELVDLAVLRWERKKKLIREWKD